MNRTRVLLTVAGLMAVAASVNAQPPGYRPPNSSPAFGWLGRGTPTERYLTLVRPQQNAQAAFQNLQQQVDSYGRGQAGPDQNDLTSEGIRPTGRGATFMNFGHYYPRLGGGAAPRAASPAPIRR